MRTIATEAICEASLTVVFRIWERDHDGGVDVNGRPPWGLIELSRLPLSSWDGPPGQSVLDWRIALGFFSTFFPTSKYYVLLQIKHVAHVPPRELGTS